MAWLRVMSYEMDKPRGEERRKLGFEKTSRDVRPFDPSELDALPQPRDDDPPYRPWWVVER